MSDAPDNARPTRRKGYYRRQIELDAAKQGLTVEEYGVYKGSTGSAIKPINSAGGLLFLSILITLICIVVVGLAVVLLGSESVTNWVQLIISLAIVVLLVPTSWAYYFKERKAARLRKQNGKTIELPTRRNTARD